MKTFLVLSLSLFFAPNSYADVCTDIRQELLSSLSQVPAPGASIGAQFHDGKTCFESVGIFDVARGSFMEPLSQLKIWSISKTFTHLLVLQLVDEGKLSLETSLYELEQKFPNLYQGQLVHYPSSKSIQIWHLLSHTSGIIDYMQVYFKNWQLNLKPGQLIKHMASIQPQFAPGDKNLYSNTTMLILARLIEEIRQHSYEEEIQNRILKPLGMNRSYVSTHARGWGQVHGYTLVPTSTAPFYYYLDVTQKVYPAMVWGTGAIVSTTDDMMKWFTALINSKLLPQSLTKRMFTPAKLNNGKEAEFGLGVRITKFSNGFVLLGHGGGPIEGNSATMLYSPVLKTMIITMANGASENSNSVLGKIGWQRAAKYLSERK